MTAPRQPEPPQGDSVPALSTATAPLDGSPAPAMSIRVTENGPYEVEGGIPLAQQFIETNAEGGSWEWRQGESFKARRKYFLCRCGGSQHKPFCDSSHERNGFVGTETASRAPYLEQAQVFDGPELTLTDEMPLCAFARFCDPEGQIWNLVEESGERARDLTMREAAHCPSGRLIAWKKMMDGALEPAGEPEFEPSIGLVEDPSQGCSGGLWVRGSIQIYAADGTPYEVRNRVTLCRCGQSKNKPFCDGTHASVGFKDGLPGTENRP